MPPKSNEVNACEEIYVNEINLQHKNLSLYGGIGFVDLLFVHLYISPVAFIYFCLLNAIALKRYTGMQRAICREESVLIRRNNSITREGTSPLSAHTRVYTFACIPSKMQIKIYWPVFLLHIRVSSPRYIPEKITETFIIFFSTFFSLPPSPLSFLSHYSCATNFRSFARRKGQPTDRNFLHKPARQKLTYVSIFLVFAKINVKRRPCDSFN